MSKANGDLDRTNQRHKRPPLHLTRYLPRGVRKPRNRRRQVDLLATGGTLQRWTR